MYLGSRLARITALSLVPSLFFAVATAAPKSQAERKAAQEVYHNTADEPPSMDPNKQVDSLSGFWINHIWEGLMTYDKTGATVAGAAESYSVSPDGKKYTFKIRKNSMWHDGKPVSAKDFEFAFRRLVDPKFASEYSFIAETAQIANATEIIAGKKPTTELGAKAVDDSTFEVTLNNPVAFFPSLMAFSAFYPVRQEIVEKHGDKFATNVESIVGNGPFKLVSWQKETSMRVEKAANYWNASTIKLNAIEAPVIVKDSAAAYNLFRTGGIDDVGLDTERLKQANKDKLRVKSYQDGSMWYLQMNTVKGKIFENKKLRQALVAGLNRAQYVNKISAIPGDKASIGLVPDYMPGSKPGSTYRKEAPISIKDADLATAKKLIKEYLAETKQTKVPSFSILSQDSSTAKRDAEYFQASLSKLFDTEVKIETVPFKTRLQRGRDKQFDIGIYGWGPDYQDALTFMDLFMSNNSNNNTGFANKDFDDLILKAQKSNDLGERVEIFKKAEALLIDEAPIAVFYQRGRAYTEAPGLTGVRRPVFGADPDYRFASWSNASAKK